MILGSKTFRARIIASTVVFLRDLFGTTTLVNQIEKVICQSAALTNPNSCFSDL